MLIKNIFRACNANVLIFTLLICASALFSCRTANVINEDIENLFPRETDTPGWRIREQPSATQLTEQSSSLYTVSNLEKSLTARYESISYPQRNIQVTISKFSSSLKAFGVLSRERTNVIDSLDICCEAYFTSSGMFFRKDGYYVKVVSEGASEMLNELKIFAGIVIGNIKQEENLPQYINIFSDHTYNDLIYYTEGIDQLPGIKNIFVRKRDMDNKEQDIFFTKRNSATESIKEFSDILSRGINSFTLLTADKNQIAFSHDKDKYIFISQYNEWLFGIVACKSITDGRRNINILFNEIIKFEKNK